MYGFSKAAIASFLSLLLTTVSPVAAQDASSVLSSDTGAAVAPSVTASTDPGDTSDLVTKAQQGDGNAEFALGKMYLAGGPNNNKKPTKARALLQQAADVGVGGAM